MLIMSECTSKIILPNKRNKRQGFAAKQCLWQYRLLDVRPRSGRSIEYFGKREFAISFIRLEEVLNTKVVWFHTRLSSLPSVHPTSTYICRTENKVRKTPEKKLSTLFYGFVNFATNIVMQWQEYISSDPEILFGKPVIKGTRVPVDLILEKLAVGHSNNDLLNAYPRLTT